jgi:hypothetical protein
MEDVKEEAEKGHAAHTQISEEKELPGKTLGPVNK